MKKLGLLGILGICLMIPAIGGQLTPGNLPGTYSGSTTFNFHCQQDQTLFGMPCEGPYHIEYTVVEENNLGLSTEFTYQAKFYTNNKRAVKGFRVILPVANLVSNAHTSIVANLTGEIQAEYNRGIIKSEPGPPLATGTITVN